jgi:hypothetical protein
MISLQDKTKTTWFKESLGGNVSKELILKRILEEPDFIKCVKFNNSLNKYLLANESADDSVIARLLMLTEEEVEEIYQEAVDILRKSMVGSGKE